MAPNPSPKGWPWSRPGENKGFIDRTGTLVIQPRAHIQVRVPPARFSDGLILIKQGSLLGYLTRTGQVAVKPQYVNAPGL